MGLIQSYMNLRFHTTMNGVQWGNDAQFLVDGEAGQLVVSQNRATSKYLIQYHNGSHFFIAITQQN